MTVWFEVSINGGVGFMQTVNGEMVGYFDASGQPIVPAEGSTVFVTANDVAGPF